jgi:hypothetical protein
MPIRIQLRSERGSSAEIACHAESDNHADPHISRHISASFAHLLDLEGVILVDLSFWIPALIGLGLAALGSMFAFVKACEKV